MRSEPNQVILPGSAASNLPAPIGAFSAVIPGTIVNDIALKDLACLPHTTTSPVAGGEV